MINLLFENPSIVSITVDFSRLLPEIAALLLRNRGKKIKQGYKNSKIEVEGKADNN
jgi:hypothetical protein